MREYLVRCFNLVTFSRSPKSALNFWQFLLVNINFFIQFKWGQLLFHPKKLWRIIAWTAGSLPRKDNFRDIYLFNFVDYHKHFEREVATARAGSQPLESQFRENGIYFHYIAFHGIIISIKWHTFPPKKKLFFFCCFARSISVTFEMLSTKFVTVCMRFVDTRNWESD